MIGPCLPPSPPYPDDPSDTVDLDVIRRDLERARSRKGGGWRYISTSVYTPAVAALVAVFEAACAQIDSDHPLMIEDPDRDPLSVAVNAARGCLSEDKIRALFACYDPTSETAAP